jgi:putative hemolysin
MVENIVTDDRRLRLELNAKNPILEQIFLLTKGPFEKLLLLDRINRIYKEIPDQNDTRLFLENILNVMDITYQVSPEDLMNIPKTGPTVVISNHPFGGIDGIILSAILLSIRRDVKVMANYFLKMIPEISNLFISVDPFGKKEFIKDNVRSALETMRFLKAGGMISIFPAGEVSHLHLRKKNIMDPDWSTFVARLVRKTSATVVPVFFNGVNSALFQILGMVHPLMRTCLLPRELIKKTHKNIKLKIGTPIPFQRLNQMHSDEEMINYLRLRTYLQANRIEPTRRILPLLKKRANYKRSSIITPLSNHDLAGEVKNLPMHQKLIETDHFAVYHASANQIPLLLLEIGRLREITFRAEGEGTGKELDIDRFDIHYSHLFLWNKEEQEIVGAYRFCLTDKIDTAFGRNDLYTYKHFYFGQAFLNKIHPAMELGRSFVRQKYQKTYQALMLLWKGIGRYISKNPQYKNLFGLVSISKDYHSVSRQLIVSYLKNFNQVSELASFAKPRNPYKKKDYKKHGVGSSLHMLRDINWLSDLISEIESDQKGIPILIKQYLKMGGRILGFNVDRKFSNVLDVLIMIDLTETDRKMLERYLGKEEAYSFLRFHQKQLLANIA